MSTNALLERAEAIERICARAYAALASAFRDDPGAEALFRRLRAEEEQHARRIRLLAAHCRLDPKLRVQADAAAIDSSVEAASRALAEIEAGAWGSDFGAVVRRVAALEKRLAAAHVELTARSGNPALRALFEVLAAQDEAHAALLSSPAAA